MTPTNQRISNLKTDLSLGSTNQNSGLLRRKNKYVEETLKTIIIVEIQVPLFLLKFFGK